MPVLSSRVALTTHHCDRLVTFYRDGVVLTLRGDLNARLRGPDRRQITLYQVQTAAVGEGIA